MYFHILTHKKKTHLILHFKISKIHDFRITQTIHFISIITL